MHKNTPQKKLLFFEVPKVHTNMINKVQVIKKPVSIVATFSDSTTKDLLSLHTEYMLQQLNSIMLKSKALSQSEHPKGSINHQLKYCEDLGNNLSEITGQEISFLKFYKNKLIDIVDKNMTKAPLISVSCRVIEGKQTSVVNVKENDARMSSSHTK